MKILSWWKRDSEGLKRAKEADEKAEQQREAAKKSSAWAMRTLAVNHLTERFYADLRHGGKL